MCGFSGLIGFGQLSASDIQAALGASRSSLFHRGPDDSGEWVDADAQVALVHCRLSIVDLSDAGKQPMESPSGRFVIAFNGEIYNHSSIRELLAASCQGSTVEFNWRGHSDTETLLYALELWGINRTLEQLNGMFAFALWDRKDRKLYLVRDRFGEKPLYYGRLNNTFVFGSELSALFMYPKWRRQIDRNSLALFMRYNHVPMPFSIYEGINKLPPAHYLVVSKNGKQVNGPVCYWSLENAARKGIARRGGQVDDLTDELDYLLSDSVGLRMRSDVPFGAFLSGGYDSAMIAAQMQAQSSQRVNTFSIGSEDESMDESRYASAVAKHLGTNHTELHVSANDALSVIPRLPSIYDEPFADSSQIPTFLVSQLARRDVTVVLSGDGGDELFAGYNRHYVGARLWATLSKFPLGARRAASHMLARLDTSDFERVIGLMTWQANTPEFSFKLAKLRSALGAGSVAEFYDLLRAHWKSSSVVIGPSALPEVNQCALSDCSLLDQMLFMDMQTYLPDDILAKVDRASMAVSLEVRAPFLDHRLVEFAWSVPSGLKVRYGQGKWLVRELLHRHVPAVLMERPKQGFSVPIAEWLRGPLRDWAEALLDKTRLEQEGFFDASEIRVSWERHMAGIGHEEHRLWCVLMFQAWLDDQASVIRS